MKKSFLGSLLVILLMVTCSKEQHTKETASTDIGTIEVSEHFEWRMSRNIALTLYNETPQLFEISSPDGSLRYHKGNHPGDNQAYPVSISMPFTENKLLVNGAEYTINSKSYKINNIQNKAMNAPFIDGYQLSREGSIENYALLFDGVEDYLNLGDIAELNEVNAFSIEGWANPNNTSATATIFSKTASDAYDIQLRTEGGKLVVELGNGSNSFGSWGDYAWSIANGSWFHWALTFDGAAVGNAERLKLYINGAAVPLDFSGNIPASTSAQLQGNSAFISAVNNSFSGVMDEVRIWSVARTADEIQALQGQIIPPMATYLAAYWRFDEADGNIINDETDHAYHGTLVGSSWQVYANGWDSDSDGVPDTDDDHPLDYNKAFDNFYPASTEGTLAFEDIWPCLGDADYNDLIMGYRFQTITNINNHVVQVVATFTIRANGAVQENGFGFELPDASAAVFSNVSVSGYMHTTGTINIDPVSHFESGQNHPVVMVVDNITKAMPGYSNTVQWMTYEQAAEITIVMDVNPGINLIAEDFSISTWNPFIFIHKIRANEVHLLNYPPTDLANTSSFGKCADASDPRANTYYRTANNVPWVLDFPVSFDYPVENTDISMAYLQFRNWVASGGSDFTDWYINTSDGYRKDAFIYQVPE